MIDQEHPLGAFEVGIVGRNTTIPTPYGARRMIYADWTASGRAYRPIDERLQRDIGPYIANAHSEASQFLGKVL